MSKLLGRIKKEVNRDHFPPDLKTGLTSDQVQQRVNDGLLNKTKKQVSKSYFKIIYDNLINVTNLVLYATAIVMIIAGISFTKFAFIGILVLNIAIGLFQDIRARRLLDKLKVVASINVTVLRDGKEQVVKSNEVVLSDIIVVKQGNQLVCDGEILEGFVEMNESLLTGESANVSKSIGDKVYSGSFVSSGRALYRVNHIGKENYAEKLQQNAKKFKRVKSEILSTIRAVFRIIMAIVFILAVVQVIFSWGPLNDIEGGGFKESIEHISGSIIAMVPIGMYLLTSLTLAVGAINLAKRKMLTQDMYSIESLARVDTLCLDKTGTITDGQLSVLKVESTSKVKEDEIKQILKTLVETTKDENSTSKAIMNEFKDMKSLSAHSGVPFNSERKYSAVMLNDGCSYVLGAREFIPHSKKEIDKQANDYEKLGLRVLVVAKYKHVIKPEEPLKESEIIGLIVLQDHIKDDAAANIKWFNDNGVDIRIITGDNPESASEIAKRVGIKGAEKFISLEGMEPEKVREIARKYVIFGRVTPEQKQIIIESLKDEGRTVAMTGDGVNDILALRVADCSIAMASGSDAAKNVAHLVSADSSFSALPNVVKEGRRVINNLQRAVSLFLVKTVFGMVITILVLTKAFKLTDVYPFTPNNLYVWELVSIGFGSLFLSLQPNEDQIKSKFYLNILFRLIPAAVVQIAFVIFFYLFCDNVDIARSLSVFAISIFSFIILVRICLPFDIYRLLLVIALAIVTSGLFVADFFIKPSVFGIEYSLLGGHEWLVLALTMLVGVALYALLSFGASKLHKYIDLRREERKYDRI